MRTTKFALLAAVAMSAFPQAVWAADEVAADEAESTEIVVTGQKRNERVQDIPAAITALGADALQDRAVAKPIPRMLTADRTGPDRYQFRLDAERQHPRDRLGERQRQRLERGFHLYRRDVSAAGGNHLQLLRHCRG
jgi:hypothetical protein